MTSKFTYNDHDDMEEGNEAYESSADEAEEGENAPSDTLRQRGASSARIRRLFGLGPSESPPEPLVQDNSNYCRKMYWSYIPDSGFPNRVNHAVAAHRSGEVALGGGCSSHGYGMVVMVMT